MSAEKPWQEQVFGHSSPAHSPALANPQVCGNQTPRYQISGTSSERVQTHTIKGPQTSETPTNPNVSSTEILPPGAGSSQLVGWGFYRQTDRGSLVDPHCSWFWVPADRNQRHGQPEAGRCLTSDTSVSA